MSDLFQELKKKIRFWINQYNFNRVKKVKGNKLQQIHDDLNILFITFDSCRYDTLVRAKTPYLDQLSKIYSAWSPATYTLPAHVSFFTGIFPQVNEELPYINRFIKQLIKIHKGGANLGGDSGNKSIDLPASKEDMIDGLNRKGYYTVGSGSANWFDKTVLVKNFQDFKYVQAQSAEAQCNYLLKKLSGKAVKKPFFAFLNCYETHTPYMHYGDDRSDYTLHARNHMSFPPAEDADLRNSLGEKLHNAQIKAAEHLDSVMSQFIPLLPANTLVMLTSDHGEAFGEDGFWGHGVYHPTVMNVPMLCFMLNGENLLAEV